MISAKSVHINNSLFYSNEVRALKADLAEFLVKHLKVYYRLIPKDY